MALGSIKPLTEMGTRNLPGVKGRQMRKAENLTAICEPIFWKMWDPRCVTNKWACMACYRDSFAFILSFIFKTVLIHFYLNEIFTSYRLAYY
jgi:hypothetical protein